MRLQREGGLKIPRVCAALNQCSRDASAAGAEEAAGHDNILGMHGSEKTQITRQHSIDVRIAFHFLCLLLSIGSGENGPGTHEKKGGGEHKSEQDVVVSTPDSALPGVHTLFWWIHYFSHALVNKGKPQTGYELTVMCTKC